MLDNAAQQIEQPRLFQPDENWERFVQEFNQVYISHAFEDALQAAIESADLNYINEGAFSAVFHCPWDMDKVIKISHAERHHGDGWLEWAEFCIRHREADWDYLPTIFELRVFRDYYIALIERYEDTVDGLDPCWSSDSEITAVACKAALIGKAFGEHFISDEVAGFAYKSGELENYEMDVDNFVNFIIDEWGDCYFGDLHGSNVMYSGDRLVITDPIGTSYDNSIDLLHKLGVYVEEYEEKEDEQYTITFI